MKDNTLYWTTKDGRVLDVDTMSDTHVRNAFKMLLRRIADARKVEHFKLNGDMAQHFNDTYPYDEEEAYERIMEDHYYFP